MLSTLWQHRWRLTAIAALILAPAIIAVLVSLFR